MISYLGVTFDELLQTFENSFAFSDDRPDRLLEEEISFTDEDEEDASDLDDSTDSDEFDDEGDDYDDTMEIDEDGQLHAYGETVADAADVAMSFLTEYIVADQIDETWLPLNEARGALLALQILLPELDEVSEVDCTYHFEIDRDATTGEPSFLTMRPLNSETALAESLTRSSSGYEGVVNDHSALAELFTKSEIPEDEQQMLADVITEGVTALAEVQCGVAFDVKAFCAAIAQLAASHQSETLQS